MLAQMELSIIGLIVQGGFAALCGYMVWAQEKRTKREDERRTREFETTSKSFAERDQYIRQLVAQNQELLRQTIESLERSTEVGRQVVSVISKCTKTERQS